MCMAVCVPGARWSCGVFISHLFFLHSTLEILHLLSRSGFGPPPPPLCRTAYRFVSALSSLESNLKQQHQAQLEDMQQAHTLALQIAVKEVCVCMCLCALVLPCSVVYVRRGGWTGVFAMCVCHVCLLCVCLLYVFAMCVCCGVADPPAHAGGSAERPAGRSPAASAASKGEVARGASITFFAVRASIVAAAAVVVVPWHSRLLSSRMLRSCN